MYDRKTAMGNGGLSTDVPRRERSGAGLLRGLHLLHRAEDSDGMADSQGISCGQSWGQTDERRGAVSPWRTAFSDLVPLAYSRANRGRDETDCTTYDVRRTVRVQTDHSCSTTYFLRWCSRYSPSPGLQNERVSLTVVGMGSSSNCPATS